MSILGSDYDIQGGGWVVRDRGGTSPPLSRSIYRTRHASAISQSVPPKLLGKRPTPETKPPPPKLSIPKSPPIPMHHRAKEPMNDNKLSELTQSSGYPRCLVKQPRPLSVLSPEEIFRLQDTFEGQLNLNGISSEEVSKWEREHPGVMENKKVWQEYNFLNQSFIIKCSPLPTHEALAQFFTQSILGSLFERFGVKEAGDLVRVSSGMSFTRFSGDFCGKSVKIPDAYAMLPGAGFPTVVCEAGWSEKVEALLDDARLWLLHTNGQTRAVILVSFTESYAGSSPEVGNNGPEVEKDIPEVGKGKTVMGVGDDKLGGGGEKDAEEPVALSEEQMVVESIDETTRYHALAARLLDLNRQGKLKEPLVGTLGATVHVYKACEDGKEIKESFMATLLPPPEGDLEPPEGNLEEEEISGFGVELVDLLGDNVPKGHDPKNKVMFSLKELEKFVRTSLPQTEMMRSCARAVKLLSAAGQWEERETWAQRGGDRVILSLLLLPYGASSDAAVQWCEIYLCLYYSSGTSVYLQGRLQNGNLEQVSTPRMLKTAKLSTIPKFPNLQISRRSPKSQNNGFLRPPPTPIPPCPFLHDAPQAQGLSLSPHENRYHNKRGPLHT
ncbi:hypothetical protein HOY80DRAFT_1111223 [Tuber brumale]|nr:hypothetical protein HOY80DRAFT_1111223 [Tuber brumale]